ncbi:MAG: UTP--glucose-1-phosphate uridylyltransferase [Nitrospiraceae bacterium]|nr:MAG: UTP--glucose-1-phosphate uridylyltransferase [Nitrospiraceae bacterium]
MPNELIQTIISDDEALRNRSINSLLQGKGNDELMKLAEGLETFRKSSNNLYHKVRASLFLFVIYGHYLQSGKETLQFGKIPFEGVKAAFGRDFEGAVSNYLSEIKNSGGCNSALFSALSEAYYSLSFRHLLDQVKLSISHCRGNHLLFNINGLDDYPYSVSGELTTPDADTGIYPIGMDTSPVRLDPSHSGWSDIFFLGMDFPEGARVVNLSVNLRIRGNDGPILPPCECYTRFIEEPVIYLKSIDLKSSKKIYTLRELFNFGNDYLSLLKAGVAASGIVPPCFENRDIALKDILHKLLGKPGGIEIVTKVNGIPKGSRLAVSTTLLSTIITRLMRFSGQIKDQTGTLTDEEKRTVASRAILGEWLGGSGGGWQDSGGLWPGIKVITGKTACAGDPEFGVSRGCLLPEHSVFSESDLSEGGEQKILDSMVLVHGGISQDVGPVLEMVTEKYLLKYEKEWKARLKGIQLFDKIVEALKTGDMKELGRLTTEDWEEAIQKVIPWVNNAFTEDLIKMARDEYGSGYWGFLMLGGMSGGGMAFIVDPEIRDNFKSRIAMIMNELKQKYGHSLPFIIDPVVYDFEINHEGIVAKLFKGKEAKMPSIDEIPSMSLIEASATKQSLNKEIAAHPSGARNDKNALSDENKIKTRYGFDTRSHEHMKALLKNNDIGLAKNRLPLTTRIEDVEYDEIPHFEEEDYLTAPSTQAARYALYETGAGALSNNEIAVVTFAGGMGSRWSSGAAVVKPVNPFVRMNGKYRTFIEMHLAKSRKTGLLFGHHVQHAFTTSYLTHDVIAGYLEKYARFNYKGRTYLSLGKSIAHRVYPMERDLRFYWEEQLRQKMDENVQKVQDDAHRALIEWAKAKGEGEDYCENKPILRFNPPGHWHEIPNLIKSGILARMLKDNPHLKYLLCHNIDTMGAYIEPAILGLHINTQARMTFEVTPRRIEDKGGGLARVDGYVRLVEGMALPREEDEYNLSHYNTNTCWISVDSLLDYFGLGRGLIIEAADDHGKQNVIYDAIYKIEKTMPAYVTLKEVKYVWGSGQEDTYPVVQFEKLWGDMTGLKDLRAGYISVSRFRGQQLKAPALLDRWVTDGSFDYVRDKCSF